MKNKLFITIVFFFASTLISCTSMKTQPETPRIPAGSGGGGDPRIMEFNSEVEALNSKAREAGLSPIPQLVYQLDVNALHFVSMAVDIYQVVARNPDVFDNSTRAKLAKMIPVVLIRPQTPIYENNQPYSSFYKGDDESGMILIDPSILSRLSEVDYKTVVLHSYLGDRLDRDYVVSSLFRNLISQKQ